MNQRALDAGSAEALPAPAQEPPSDWTSFRRLMLGESVSSFGLNLSLVAIPLYAVLYLNASAAQVSAINIAIWAPPLILGLIAGKRADRMDRRRAMVAADLLAGMASLALAWLMWTRALSLPVLYLIVFAIAGCGTFYALGSAALVPNLLAGPARGRGNSRLAAARALSDGAAQLLAARLVSVAAGALVVALDALTYLFRALLVGSIRPDPVEGAAEPAEPVDRTIRSTWAILRRNPELMRLMGAQGTLNVGGAFILAFFYPYAYQGVGLEPFHIGVMLALGHFSAFAGAFLLPALLGRRDLGSIAALALGSSAAAVWLLPLAHGSSAFAMFLVYEALFSVSTILFSVAVTTRRQHLTPSDHQGRMSSFTILFGYACLIAGGLLAVAATPLLEPRMGIVAGCVLSSVTLLWFVRPRLRPGPERA
jgi:MFS family permease